MSEEVVWVRLKVDREHFKGDDPFDELAHSIHSLDGVSYVEVRYKVDSESAWPIVKE